MLYMGHDNDRINALRGQDFLAEAEHDRLAHAAMEIAIPQEIALQFCREIRQERMSRWYAPGAWICRACVGMGKDGVPARLNAGDSGLCRCPNVITRYRRA